MSCSGGSPLLFTLVDASGPVRAISPLSPSSAGIRIASDRDPAEAGIGAASGRMTVRGAGQIEARKFRCLSLSDTPRARGPSRLIEPALQAQLLRRETSE